MSKNLSSATLECDVCGRRSCVDDFWRMVKLDGPVVEKWGHKWNTGLVVEVCSYECYEEAIALGWRDIAAAPAPLPTLVEAPAGS